jgi:uncharacterized protein YbjT (DUF2867 family)
MIVLVASASSNTATHAIHELSSSGKVDIRCMVRNLDKATEIAKLPHCTVIKGDFNDEESLAAALKGVDRAMLVSSAGTHEQFDMEVAFISAATAAGVKAIVRISTMSALIHPGTTNVYGRAHSSTEQYIDYHKSPVIDLCPNWFFDNFLSSAAEAKGAGTMSYPVAGTGHTAMIDTRDVGSAAATILLLDESHIKLFLKARKIELHGPEMHTFQDVAATLSKTAGHEIKIHEVPAMAWRDTLVGYGMSKIFANSFVHTVYAAADDDYKTMSPRVNTSSPLLASINWHAKHTLDDWASQTYVVNAFKKE